MSGDFEGWARRPLRSSPDPALLLREPTGSPAARPTSDVPAMTGFDPAEAYLASLGPGSRRTMREALDKLARWASDGRCDATTLPWHGLRIEHTAALRTRLAASLAPATANKHLAALRGVLKQCWRAGRMPAEQYQRAIDLPSVRGESPRRAQRLGPDDLERLVVACESDRTPAGARDAALLALLYGAQLRRSEAVALDLADYDMEAGELVARSAGSGRTRRFRANPDARNALERWIGQRGRAPGPLFNPVNKGGRVEPRRLSEQAIYIACQKRAAAAGLPPTSPEDLRRAETDPARIAVSRLAEGASSPT